MDMTRVWAVPDPVRSQALAFGLAFALAGAGVAPAWAADKKTEEAAEIATFVLGNTLFTLYHELGHALIDKLGIPVLGKEEDAVDGLATLLMLPEDSDDRSDELILAAADGYGLAHDQGSEDELAFWDSHSLDLQRYGAVNCLIFGSDPEGFADLAKQIEMPESEQARCPETYEQTLASWVALLDQHFREDDDDEDGGRIHIRFDPPDGDIDPALVAFLKASPVIAEAVAGVAESVILPEDFNVVFASCGTINAFYDPGTGDVTMCYEIVAYFGKLIAEDLKAR